MLLVLPTLAALVMGATPPEAQPKLLVMGVAMERGIDPSLGSVLEDVLLTEMQRLGRYDVVGSSDVQALINQEVQRMQTGCSDVACMSEISGALGAQYLVMTSVSRVGEGVVINLKLIDSNTVQAVGRSSQTTDSTEDAVLAGVRRAVADIFGEVVTLPVGPIVLGGAAVVAAVAGIAMGTRARGVLDVSPADPRYASRRDKANSLALGTTISFTLAILSAASAATWFWLGRPEPPKASVFTSDAAAVSF